MIMSISSYNVLFLVNRNCEDDYALYKAMNLSFLFDIRTAIINFTEVSGASQ